MTKLLAQVDQRVGGARQHLRGQLLSGVARRGTSTARSIDHQYDISFCCRRSTWLVHGLPDYQYDISFCCRQSTWPVLRGKVPGETRVSPSTRSEAVQRVQVEIDNLYSSLRRGTSCLFIDIIGSTKRWEPFELVNIIIESSWTGQSASCNEV